MFEGRVEAYSGTHGTGKTTAVYEAVARLKKAHPGKVILPLGEAARQSPFPINQDGGLQTQLWLFMRHVTQEMARLSMADLVVSDRSALDYVAYSRVLGFRDLAAAQLDMFRHHCRVYGRIVFMTKEQNNWCADDGVRAVGDEIFRSRVQEELLSLYERVRVDLGACEIEVR